MLIILISAFAVSFLASLLAVRYKHLHIHITGDRLDGGPQKFHAQPIPRVGGILILSAFVAGMVLSVWEGSVELVVLGLLLVSALPIFLGGLLEDMSRHVRPIARLLLSFLAAGLGFYLLDARLVRLDIYGIDYLLTYWVFSLSVTLIAVGGVTHAFNIVDGYNGLMGIVSLMILAALGYVSYLVHDDMLVAICLSASGAVLGFLLWNYPRGLIFAGDSGAYLLGFLIAEISVLLVARHPEVSAWFPMLLVAYPVWETTFSIFRRKFLRGRSPGAADGLHLHSLVYKRVMHRTIGSKEARLKLRRNSMTSPYLWGLTLLTVLPGVLFWRSTPVLVSLTVLFAFCYSWIYWRIVHFHTPRRLVTRKASKSTRKPPIADAKVGQKT